MSAADRFQNSLEHWKDTPQVLLAVDTEAWFIKYNGLLKQLICYICQKQDKDFEIQKPRYLFWSERTQSLSKDHFYPFESWSTQ